MKLQILLSLLEAFWMKLVTERLATTEMDAYHQIYQISIMEDGIMLVELLWTVKATRYYNKIQKYT